MKKNEILAAIIKITEESNTKKIDAFKTMQMKKNAKPIMQKYACNTEEAILFAILFGLYFERGHCVEMSDIARHLDCKAIELMPYEVHIRSLLKKRLIALDYNYTTQRSVQFSYRFKNEMIRSITNDTEQKPKLPINSNITLLAAMQDAIEQYLEKEIGIIDVEEIINDMLQEHESIAFAHKLKSLSVSFELKLFLLHIAIQYYKGNSNIDLSEALSELFWENKQDFYSIKQVIMQQNIVLFQLNILKIKPSEWRNDVDVELTNNGAEYLFGEDANLIRVNNKGKTSNHTIQAESISEKTLFYNAADLPTIHFIEELFQEEKYLQISNRLKENNMQNGVAILLHGKPGTGKTETVYQLAKKSQRNIYRAEISELKSMWFGESQKLIKNLFNNYYQYAETQKQMPILFFNEADAIINKRKDSNSSNVAQTENEIQNIILQEMEDFRGILIATTNLIDNLDTAFERRFLFKLELTTPTEETRFKIYRSMLPNLDDNDLHTLARAFDFSGGTIQNIVRKATMHHVLHGSYPDIAWYMDTCKQEKYKTENNSKKIGF